VPPLQTKSQQTGGFTLLELVVASAVALTILSIALGVMSDQRRWVLGDRARATANDGLRLASDLIGQDIKQAGERLDADIFQPGVSIIPGTSALVRDTLVLQRQLLTEKLPVCQSISQGSSAASVDISVVNGSAINNCKYSYSTPTGGEIVGSPPATLLPTDNLRSLRTYRCTLDGPATATVDPCARTSNTANCQQMGSGNTDKECAWAYIYDPKINKGEFFLYSYENQGACSSTTAFPAPARNCQKIWRADGLAWQNNYVYDPTGAAGNQPQIYIFEERRYSLAPDASSPGTFFLQLSVNRQTPINIANQVSDFQVWAKVPTSYDSAPYSSPSNWGCAVGGSTGPSPDFPNQWYCSGFNIDTLSVPKYINDWQELQGVRITLTSNNPNQTVLNENTSHGSILSLTSEFFPRNVTSR
jgi:type II secretory pathway pseudopilin PulG